MDAETQQIFSKIQKYITETAYDVEFGEKLQEQIITQIFELMHTMGYKDRIDALDELRRLSDEIFVAVADCIENLDDPFEKQDVN
jgi:hypothetical protein